VIRRFESDLPLLKGLLHVFTWLCPDQARELPHELRKQFGLSDPPAEGVPINSKARIDLLDSRPWFAAFQPIDKPMKL
jgi:hypothetical protein